MANKSSNKPLANIYAQALYEAAVEAGAQEQVGVELAGLAGALKNDAKFAEFFESPTIAFESKRKVVEEALKGYSAITRNFLLVLTARGRSAFFSQIVESFTEYAERQAGIAAVEVTSARTLDADEREKLLQVLGNKLGCKIKLNERVNPELIGGMVVVHEDKMWDSSLRHKLDGAVRSMEELKTSAVKWGD